MSRQNKVNPGRYKVAGRLSPDDLGRERRRQSMTSIANEPRRQRQALPFWQATDPAPPVEVGPSRALADRSQSTAATPRAQRKARTTTAAKVKTKARVRKDARATRMPKQAARKASAGSKRAAPASKRHRKPSAKAARTGTRKTTGVSARAKSKAPSRARSKRKSR